MPYISNVLRAQLETRPVPQTAGELNYLITKMLTKYVETRGASYQTYNDIIGALEGAKLEIYRREIAEYENQKRFDNGDVY